MKRLFFLESFVISTDNLKHTDYQDIALAFLKIKAFNISSAYKEQDKLYLDRLYGSFGVMDTIWKKEDNRVSAYYPAYQKCIINGIEFKLNEEKIFYDEKIKPGDIEIISAFKPVYYDGVTKQETPKDEYRKKVTVKVKRDEKVNVDIVFIYRGNEPDIVVRAYKVNEVLKDNVIETNIEHIEVFD